MQEVARECFEQNIDLSEVETKCSALSVSPSLGTLPPSFRVEGEDDD